ncbi:putative carbonic anhydrase-like protein 2 [Lepeophtheirus salmonis]|uniref:putative carbonic anhydrase-like protein 2 n=1 Tax=Lepeophtheirus salmonis TaxID=72036 RepID=UPI001AE7F3CF|nr:putative carbonic anhydrase-like protein 2 [Lepeophtheirus salmonis]
MNMFLVLSFLFLYTTFVSANWQEWWTYDGISGPWYWGVINPSWAMCAKGRKQSPINIDPRALLYDPGLKYFNVDKRSLDGTLENTGQFLVFKVESDRMSKMPVNITGGPLAYRYQFEKMIFHWGNDMGRDLTEEDESESNEEDEEGRHADPSHGGSQVRRGYRLVPGSEHSIDGKAFPAEIQLYGFNAHIFKNLSEAVHHPHGVVGVSILVQEAERGASPGLRPITSQLEEVTYKGQNIPITNLNLAEIMPDTDNYMTYEGSTTYPGCWETVTWILMNKPIYVTRSELLAFRQLMRGDRASPKAPLGNNIRTLQGLNARNIRTNLKFDVSTDMVPSKKGSRFFHNKKNKGERSKHRQPSMPVSCPDVLNGVRFQTSSWVKSMSP